METLDVKISGGSKNTIVTFLGIVTADMSPRTIFTLRELPVLVKGLRLDAITFALQEKMGLHLCWELESESKCKYEYIVTLESRGYFDFERVQGLHSPPGMTGLSISSFKVDEPKGVLVMLDFTKQ